MFENQEMEIKYIFLHLKDVGKKPCKFWGFFTGYLPDLLSWHCAPNQVSVITQTHTNAVNPRPGTSQLSQDGHIRASASRSQWWRFREINVCCFWSLFHLKMLLWTTRWGKKYLFIGPFWGKFSWGQEPQGCQSLLLLLSKNQLVAGEWHLEKAFYLHSHRWGGKLEVTKLTVLGWPQDTDLTYASADTYVNRSYIYIYAYVYT